MTRAEVPLLKGHTQQLHSPQPLHATLQASGERRAAGAGAGSLGTLGWRGVCMYVCVCVWRGGDAFALWAKSNQTNMEEVEQKESD